MLADAGKVYAKDMELHHVLQRLPRPVYRPRGDHVESPPRRVRHHAGEGRALVPALRTTDAVVFIDLDRFPAAELYDSRSWLSVVCSVVETRR